MAMLKMVDLGVNVMSLLEEERDNIERSLK